MSIQRAGIIASLILMLFLLTGGYYVQVCMLWKRSTNIEICSLNYTPLSQFQYLNLTKMANLLRFASTYILLKNFIFS